MSPPAQVIQLRDCRSGAPVGIDQRADEQLMQLAAAGVAQAFAEIVRRHQAAVRCFCRRWCGDSCIGDELAQDVFVDLWRARRTYDPRGRFEAWLFTLARNRCRSERRRRVRTEPAADPSPATDDPLDVILRAERQRRIDDRIRHVR